jgi:hypothetical protein
VSGKPGSKLWYKPVYSGGSWNQFLLARSVGTVLQVCCGGSDVGVVRVDRDPTAYAANVIADQLALPFRDRAFDTVACDPLYELDYPNRIKLQRELARVARLRVVFKAPWVPRMSGFKLGETVLIGSHTCANVAVMSVLDKASESGRLPL